MSAEAAVEDGQVTESGEIWEGVVPGILRGLYVGRRTGTLTFERGGEHRGVHFRRGCIVNADTDVRDDRLGQVLQRAGRLSDADRKRAEGFALRDGRRLGSVLVEMGLLDRSGLEEALALHVDAVLSRVFAWPDGRYEFRHYAQLPLADEMTLRVSTGDVILQAAHSVTDPDVVRYNLGSLDRALVASSDPLLRFQRIRLTTLDGYVMSRVDGTLTARQVVGLVPAPKAEVERSLFGLLSTGIIEYRGERRLAGGLAAPAAAEAPAASAESAEPAEPAEPATAPAQEAAPVAASEPAARPEEEPRLASPEAVPPADRPDLALAEVDVETPRGEPTVILDAPSFVEGPPVDPTVVLDPATLNARLPVDPTVILDAPVAPPRRADPEPQAAPAPAPGPAPTADRTVFLREVPQLAPADLRRLEILDMYQGLKTRTHFELLGVPRDATEAQVREAYFRLAKRFHPDGQHEEHLGATRDALEKIFRRLGEAYEVLRNPRIRVVYEKNLARQPRPPAEASGPVTVILEAPDAAVERAAASFAAERYWEVIQILEKAVPRAEGPLKRRGRLLLARAYARTPDWVKQAEELLVAVAQEDPAEVEAHLQLGLIYRGQGLRARALKSFRRVLELAPGHAEAQRQATELSGA
ncbi:MAG: DnaJ domain-containing protein [Vicinamibacteria bacterium]